jgi:hypothetical protein
MGLGALARSAQALATGRSLGKPLAVGLVALS